MSKNVQAFTLFNALKAAGPKGISKDDVAKILGVADNSVPVYIFNLRKTYNANLKVVKDGRKIVAYILENADTVAVPQVRKNARGTSATPKAKKAVKAGVVKAAPVTNDGSVSILDDDLEISDYGDAELRDIADSLGV